MTKQSQDLNTAIHFLWYIVCHLLLPTQPLYAEREMAHHPFPWLLRETAISRPFLLLPLSSFLPLSCLFSSLVPSGCFFHPFMLLLCLIWRRRKNPVCFSLTQTTETERETVRDEDFGHRVHTQLMVSQHASLGNAGLYFKQRFKLCSFHFQKAWTGLQGALKSRGGESSYSYCPLRREDRPVCRHVCMPAFATQLPWGPTGHEIYTEQKSVELSDNIYTTRLFITMSCFVTSSLWPAEAKETSVTIHLILNILSDFTT